jgi:hypothetical protein
VRLLTAHGPRRGEIEAKFGCSVWQITVPLSPAALIRWDTTLKGRVGCTTCAVVRVLSVYIHPYSYSILSHISAAGKRDVTMWIVVVAHSRSATPPHRARRERKLRTHGTRATTRDHCALASAEQPYLLPHWPPRSANGNLLVRSDSPQDIVKMEIPFPPWTNCGALCDGPWWLP